MNNDISLFDSFLSIMTNRINLDGKCDDGEVCKDIAAFINMLPNSCYYLDSLYDFIAEYGEDADEDYMGRDEHGEKVYHMYNRETNWHDRIRKELVAIGYYERLARERVAA